MKIFSNKIILLLVIAVSVPLFGMKRTSGAQSGKEESKAITIPSATLELLPEIWQRILAFCSPSALNTGAKVCRDWYSWALKDAIIQWIETIRPPLKYLELDSDGWFQLVVPLLRKKVLNTEDIEILRTYFASRRLAPEIRQMVGKIVRAHAFAQSDPVNKEALKALLSDQERSAFVPKLSSGEEQVKFEGLDLLINAIGMPFDAAWSNKYWNGILDSADEYIGVTNLRFQRSDNWANVVEEPIRTAIILGRSEYLKAMLARGNFTSVLMNVEYGLGVFYVSDLNSFLARLDNLLILAMKFSDRTGYSVLLTWMVENLCKIIHLKSHTRLQGLHLQTLLKKTITWLIDRNKTDFLEVLPNIEQLSKCGVAVSFSSELLEYALTRKAYPAVETLLTWGASLDPQVGTMLLESLNIIPKGGQQRVLPAYLTDLSKNDKKLFSKLVHSVWGFYYRDQVNKALIPAIKAKDLNKVEAFCKNNVQILDNEVAKQYIDSAYKIAFEQLTSISKKIEEANKKPVNYKIELTPQGPKSVYSPAKYLMEYIERALILQSIMQNLTMYMNTRVGAGN